MRGHRPPAEILQRARGWLLPAALLALTPKCVLCVLAYTGLGVALGMNGPEMCGAPAAANGFWLGLPLSAIVVGLALWRRRA